MARTVRKKKKKPPRKFGVEGPRADFNSGLLLDIVASRAARDEVSRHTMLTRLLTDAGFTDVPPNGTWRQWEIRRKIASSWMPTILYATLARGEKINIRQLLTVHE